MNLGKSIFKAGLGSVGSLMVPKFLMCFWEKWHGIFARVSRWENFSPNQLVHAYASFLLFPFGSPTSPHAKELNQHIPFTLFQFFLPILASCVFLVFFCKGILQSSYPSCPAYPPYLNCGIGFFYFGRELPQLP